MVGAAVTTPLAKCMALVPNPTTSPWCPLPKDPRTPDNDPRCTGHMSGATPKENPR